MTKGQMGDETVMLVQQHINEAPVVIRPGLYCRLSKNPKGTSAVQER